MFSGIHGHYSFTAFIGDYLQDKTKNDLRSEMENPLSEADALGYIYTLEYPGEYHSMLQNVH
jgi:hypothetical protein